MYHSPFITPSIHSNLSLFSHFYFIFFPFFPFFFIFSFRSSFFPPSLHQSLFITFSSYHFIPFYFFFFLIIIHLHLSFFPLIHFEFFSFCYMFFSIQLYQKKLFIGILIFFKFSVLLQNYLSKKLTVIPCFSKQFFSKQFFSKQFFFRIIFFNNLKKVSSVDE